MNQGKSTVVAANDLVGTTLYTEALAGCTACAVRVPLADGGQFLALTHYWAIAQDENVVRLRGMINTLDRPLHPLKRPFLLILEPKQYGDGLQLLPPGSSTFSQQLSQGVSDALQGRLDTHFEPYSPGSSSTLDQGTLVAGVDSKGEAFWQTWFSAGKLE